MPTKKPVIKVGHCGRGLSWRCESRFLYSLKKPKTKLIPSVCYYCSIERSIDSRHASMVKRHKAEVDYLTKRQ